MNMPVFISGTTYLTLGDPWPGCFGYRPLVEIKRQPHMTSRRLKSGQTAYFWQLPKKARQFNIALHAEPLGSDFVQACRRAEKLNVLYEACVKPIIQ
jgi:hypothetical protein